MDTSSAGFADIELPSITPEERADLQKEALEFEREALVRDLEPTEYFSYLRSKRVLDASDCEDIRSERTRKSKSERFLDVIACRGSAGYTQFCKAVLERRVQAHLVKKLNVRMAELESSYRRRKAIVLMSEKWKKENLANVRRESIISEEERHNIIESMRHGLPIPSLTAIKVSSNDWDTDDYPSYPERSSSPSSASNSRSAVECYQKHDSNPSVVMSRYGSSNSSSVGLVGTVTPDTYVLGSLKDDDEQRRSSFPVRPMS
eukprot:scpid23031/ scgid16304/ 